MIFSGRFSVDCSVGASFRYDKRSACGNWSGRDGWINNENGMVSDLRIHTLGVTGSQAILDEGHWIPRQLP